MSGSGPSAGWLVGLVGRIGRIGRIGRVGVGGGGARLAVVRRVGRRSAALS